MLSAKEAKKKTQEITNRRISNELKEIENLINDAINLDCFSITRSGCLHSTIKEELEKYGYKVETGNQYNEFYHRISWE